MTYIVEYTDRKGGWHQRFYKNEIDMEKFLENLKLPATIKNSATDEKIGELTWDDTRKRWCWSYATIEEPVRQG